MAHGKKKAPSTAWTELEARCLWDDQIDYEIVRPVVLKEQRLNERAQEVGLTPKALRRKVRQFVQFGLPGLVPTTGHRSDDKRVLPLEIRQQILILKAEHPPLTAHEIATICELRFGRGSNYRAVQRVLDTEVPSKVRGRRFPLYQDEPDPEQRRHNIVQLYLEGWTAQSSAEYFAVSRQTVHTVLRRWFVEGRAGLADRPPGPQPLGAIPLPVLALIQTYQRNPLIGEQRMHAYLKQYGHDISARTCGRIMRLHRELTQQEIPRPPQIPKKAMPFLAARRHQWWSVDIRYIEQHQVPGIAGPIYICTILDNYSRAILDSAPCPSQDLGSYLVVLFSALALYGSPEGIVSDGGSVFKANKALEIYEQLQMVKERIEPRKPWQNFVEAHFGVMRRLLDYYLERASSWQEFCDRHAEFVANYNEQEHFAHLDRPDASRSPLEVLAWVKGRPIEVATLERLFTTEQVRRHVDRSGYVQFRYWRLYGAEGLADQEAQVVTYRDTLTITHQDESLTQYQVQYADNGAAMANVRLIREFPGRFPSAQMHLWELSRFTWHKALSVPRRRPHQRSSPTDLEQLVLFSSEPMQRRRHQR